jgi:RNA recognition motif. (a.k.a. RRM, RBD, or RNP domain)
LHVRALRLSFPHLRHIYEPAETLASQSAPELVDSTRRAPDAASRARRARKKEAQFGVFVFVCRQGYSTGPQQQQQSITNQGPSNPVPQQGSVMMVYGLNLDKVNPDRLFNIFCLYGNVVRVSSFEITPINPF